MKETTFDKQTELPKLADRLGFANALIIDLRKEVSKLQLKSGKDSSYIDELEFENKRLKKELEELKKDPFRGMSLKKLAEDKLIEHWKGQIRSFEKKAKAAIFAREAVRRKN
jgi:hypothetical protein